MFRAPAQHSPDGHAPEPAEGPGRPTSPRRTAAVAAVLGAVAVASAVVTGWVAFRHSVRANEGMLRQHYREEARLLAAAAGSTPSADDAAVLERIRRAWHRARPRPSPDEYLCVVDRESRLVLHTSRPETVGEYVGDNPCLPESGRPPTSLARVVAEGSGFVGRYVSSGGDEQVAAFAAVPGHPWTVGIHYSLRALRRNIRTSVGPLTVALAAVCLVLMPASLYLTGKAFRLALRERDGALATLERSEAAQRDLARQSLQREELYRSLLTSTPDAVAIYDLEGRVQYVNPAFTRIFGFTPAEVEGQRIPFVPETEREATSAQIRKVLAGQPASGFRTRRLTKGGETLEISLSSSCYSDVHGEPAGIVVLLRDVTEERETQRRLEQAQRIETVGTLAGGVAHDFNNLLQVIQGFAELLLDAPQGADGSTRTAAREVLGAARRGRDLTRQLLAFSRRLGSRLSATDLNREASEAVRLLSRTLPKSVRVELAAAPDPLPVSVDRTQVQQVLVNLGINASHAMPEGGTFSLETRRTSIPSPEGQPGTDELPAGEYATIRARDSGSGMPPETLERVFEPFFTTKEIGQGTGLGLAMAYGIARSHGGAIACTSEPGRGTTFHLHLPLGADDAGQDVACEEPRAPAATGDDGARVLLVDDDPVVLDLGREMLERGGHRTLTATSGEEALAVVRARAGGIDLAVLDLGMPGMGGLRCIRSLREADPRLRILVASGYTGEEGASREAGAHGFLPKPYRSGELLASVAAALDPGSGPGRTPTPSAEGVGLPGRPRAEAGA